MKNKSSFFYKISHLPSLLFLTFVLFSSIASFFLVFSSSRQSKQLGQLQAPKNFTTVAVDSANSDNAGQVLGASNNFYFISSRGNNMNGGTVVLSSAAKPTLRVSSYSSSMEVNFRLYKISREDFLNYLLYENNNKDKDGFSGSISKLYQFDSNQLELVADFNQSIGGDGNSETISELNLDLDNEGLWYIEANYDGQKIGTVIVRSAIAGLANKTDNKITFWVQDAQKKLVSGAKITLINTQDKLTTLEELTTDQQGLAHSLASGSIDLALVSSQDSFTIIPINLQGFTYRSGPNSYFYSSFAARETSNRSFIFTDRFVYKPGDKVYFKAIIRDDDDADYSIPSGQVRVTLTGYEDENPYEANLLIDNWGTVDDVIQLPADIVENYVSLAVYRGDEYLTGTSFQIAEFHKPDSEINISLDEHTYFPGDKLKATVSGSYFLGQPLKNKELRYKVYQNDSYVSGDYNSVDFSHNLSNYGEGQELVEEGTIKLNNKGKADLEISVKNETGERKMWAIVLEYVDEGGATTNDGVKVLVNPGDFVIETDSQADYEQFAINRNGSRSLILQPTKPDANVANMQILGNIYFKEDDRKELFSEGLVLNSDAEGKFEFSFTPNQKGNYSAEFKTFDSHGNPIKSDINIYVYSEVSSSGYSSSSAESILIKTDKESYSPGETAVINLEADFEVKDLFVYVGRSYSREYRVLTNGTKQFELLIPEDYQPNVELNVGGFINDAWVSGSKDITVKTDDKKVGLSFAFDQDTYGPGETAIVNIEAKDALGNPVKADIGVWVFDKALLELNKENYSGIFNRFWSERYDSPFLTYSFQGLSNEVAEGGGGCFAGETQITMADGSQKNIKEVKAGDWIKTFKSVSSGQLVEAEVLGTHDVTVSGYLIVNTDLKVTPEHKLFVNDEWKLAGEIKVGDYLINSSGEKEFVTSIEWVRGKFEVYNLKVDKFHTFIANDIYVHNDKGDTRSIFKDTAYWNPHVLTDDNGQAQLSIVLPDNLTTWVIAGVAASKTTQAGEGESEFIVTKELVTRPILPTFFRQGDQIILSALISNFSKNNLKLDVVADLDIASLKNPERSLNLNAEDSTELGWETVITDYQDVASFHVKAQSADDSGFIDEVYQEIPVYKYGFWQDNFVLGVNEQNYVLSARDDESSQNTTKLQLSARKYPDFEQDLENILLSQDTYVSNLSSKLIAAGIVNQYRDKFKLNYNATQLKDINQVNAKKIAEFSTQIINSLSRDDYYLRSNLSTLEALIYAQQSGILIDQSIFEIFKNFYQAWEPTIWEERVDKQFALSLFNDGNLPLEKLSLLPYEDSEVTIKAIIANYRNGFIDAQTGIEQIMELKFENDKQLAWPSLPKSGFSGVRRSSMAANLALLELGADQQVLEKSLDYLYRNRGSQMSSSLLRAVASYLDRYTVANQQVDYEVLVDGQALASGNLTVHPISTKELVIDNDAGTSLVIKSTGVAPLYSKLISTQFISDKKLAKESHHLEIERKYLSAAKEDRAVQVGDLVIVELQVKNLGLGERDLVITDYLPSGLVAIDNSLDNGEFDDVDTDYISHQKIRGQNVELEISNARGELAVFRYKTRVISQGVFDTPPAMIKHAMQPELWARSDSTRLIIDGKNKLEMLKTDDKQVLVNLDAGLSWPTIVLGSGVGLSLGYGLWLNRVKILSILKKKEVKVDDLPDEK